jgi:hypothetical protein
LNQSFLVLCIYILLLLSCTSDVIKDLGDGYFLREEGAYVKDILCEKPNGKEIPAGVIAYDFEENFIIAIQKPKLPQDPLYDKHYNYKRGGNKFYYWIINKKNHVVIGPMDKLEFQKKREKHRISESLALE